MILRPQTVRRLMILLAAVLVLVGIGAALYARNEHRKAARLAEARQQGLAAYHAGDYQAALDSLKFYVARKKSDPEALFAYGVSRSRIEEPNGKHVFEGITVFSTLVQLDPTNLEAKHRLLDLYTQAWRNEETIDLADSILAMKGDDREALKAKSVALERLRRLDGALAASEKLNALDPKDLDQQLITYELMRKLKRPPEALVARAQRQQQASPDDPRFAMLLAMAYGNAGDVETGKQWLSRAATQPAPDATFVRHMVRVLDTLKLYAQSQQLLDRVTQQGNDPLILRVVVQRLWQNGQNERVLEKLKDLDPNSAATDIGLLAYRALAAFDAGQHGAARQIAAALGNRRTDAEAIAWATALSARFNAIEPKAALQQYQAALVRSPNNAVIRFLVGEAYARLGETELAIAAWRRAAELSPSWSTPHVEIARTLAASGRIREALAEAQTAVRAAPNQLQPIVTLANIRHKALGEGALGEGAAVEGSPDGADEAKLLKLVEQIHKIAPGEPETLPVFVNLLAKAGRRDEAIAVLRAVVSNPTKYNQSTVLRLVSVSRSHKLGLEDELQATSGGEETPRTALARAADLAAAGKPAEGLALLDARVKAATNQPSVPSTQQSVQWKLALTQYKEAIRDPSARADWVALGDGNPSDLSVQSAILKTAASARGDRAFMARSIDRLKDLTGAEGQTWKLERARWLLGGEGQKETAEAVNILNDIVRASPTLIEARLLLALAYEGANNAAGAIKALQAAAEQEPGDTSIAVELARLLQAAGRFADARTYLERAAGSGNLGDESVRRIAGMLAAQGDVVRAIKVLESDNHELDTPGHLLLADLYRRQQRLADAERVYTTLLAQQPIETDAIRAAADFYGAQRKLDQARAMLA
ncbi:MAG: tetratricopeptide repeat protein, partial [Tepidisphaeraceae bacterium]